MYATKMYAIPRRNGVTVLEVLFAIFVVVVGLLGLASIIPLAARNATESNTNNNAQALGQRWFQSFFTRSLTDHDSFTDSATGYNWQWFKDYSAGGVGPGFVNFEKDYRPLYPGNPNAIGLVPNTNQSSTGSDQGPNAGVTTSGTIARIWGHQPVCIDPTFFTEPDVVARLNSGTSRVNSYRASVFPYFEDGYNPVTDSDNAAAPWQDQPRMLRVTLGFDAASQISRKLVDEVFASTDEVVFTTFAQDPVTNEQIKDDTLPATRIFSQADDGSGVLINAKSASDGEYSWIATVSPEEPRLSQVSVAQAPATAVSESIDYLISLVVLHRRNKQFVEPGVTPVAGDPEDNPGGERLVWVYPIAGNFQGGTGGRVRLIASAGTEDSLRIGDWIMLGRHFLVDPAVPARRYSYFRWYRIIAVDQETTFGTVANVSPTGVDPYGNASNAQVWARDVVLEGPDFNFSASFTHPESGVTTVTPTTGTLLDGVITVVERNLTIR